MTKRAIERAEAVAAAKDFDVMVFTGPDAGYIIVIDDTTEGEPIVASVKLNRRELVAMAKGLLITANDLQD